VQCYLVPPRELPDAPHAILVDFQKITVPGNGHLSVEFQLPEKTFHLVNAAGEWRRHPGHYTIVVGAASPGARAVALGAPAPVTTELELT
jgi:hypothetical protein